MGRRTASCLSPRLPSHTDPETADRPDGMVFPYSEVPGRKRVPARHEAVRLHGISQVPAKKLGFCPLLHSQIGLRSGRKLS